LGSNQLEKPPLWRSST